MAAPMIGIIQQEDVALVDIVAKKFDHGLHGPGQCAHMDGNMLGLGDQSAFGTANGGGKIPAGIHDLGIGRSQHGLAHFFGDGNQAVLNDGSGNRIYIRHGIGHSTN